MPNKFSDKYGKLIEAATWIVVILIVFGVRLLPENPIDSTMTYILVGGISSFALLYYLIIYKYFSRTDRIYLKNIADVVLIGVLIVLLKDYGQYFFALYFLPLAAAALSLELINALLIATIATLFVVLNVFMGAYDLLPQTPTFLQGAWQIGLILFITIFCRLLAIEVKSQEREKEKILAQHKALEEESKKEKEFLMLASHQLYTPLSIIRGFADMLSDESLGKLAPKQKKAAQQIYNNIKRMTALVSELLSISKIQSEQFVIRRHRANLKIILSEIVSDFEQTTSNNKVELKLELPEKLAEIFIDEDKIRQVCINLIDNALKYSQNGCITIKVKQDEKETIVSVNDCGIGIKKEDREKIFEPFFRGQDILELDNKGTGLGLYICKLIVSKHGGKIWYDGSGKGATFLFSLPNENMENK